MIGHRDHPGERKAQHLLAREVLELVYGAEEASRAEAEHRASRRPSLAALTEGRTNAQPSDVAPSTGTTSASDRAKSSDSSRPCLPMSLVRGVPYSRILYHAGIVATKGEGSRMIKKGGVYVGVRGADEGEDNITFRRVDEGEIFEDTFPNRLLILRVGKWKVRVVNILHDDEFERQGHDAPGWADFKGSVSSVEATSGVRSEL